MRSLILLISFAFAGACSTGQEKGFTTISQDQFATEMADEKTVILDVRTPEEYEGGYIPGAVNIDYLGDNFRQRISELPKDGKYLVYCHSGGRSSDAGKEMEGMGFDNVSDLQGGISGWQGELEHPAHNVE